MFFRYNDSNSSLHYFALMKKSHSFKPWSPKCGMWLPYKITGFITSLKLNILWFFIFLIQVSLYFFLVFYLTSKLCFFVQLYLVGPLFCEIYLFNAISIWLQWSSIRKRTSLCLLIYLVFKHIAWPLFIVNTYLSSKRKCFHFPLKAICIGWVFQEVDMDMELGMHTVYWRSACERQQQEETELGRESLKQSCPNQEEL